MTVHCLNPVAVGPLIEQTHFTQPPFGNVGSSAAVRQVFKEFVEVKACVLFAAGEGEVGQTLIAQFDEILDIFGHTGGGQLIGQLLVTNEVFHIGNKCFLTFILGIGNTGSIIQGAPVRIVKELLEHFCGLCGGLSAFVLNQEVLQTLQTEEHGNKEQENKQEIQRIEDYTAKAGTFSFRNLLRSFLTDRLLFDLSDRRFFDGGRFSGNGIHRSRLSGDGIHRSRPTGGHFLRCRLPGGGTAVAGSNNFTGAGTGTLALFIKFTLIHDLPPFTQQSGRASSWAYVWDWTEERNSC